MREKSPEVTAPKKEPDFFLIKLGARTGVHEPAIVSVGVNGKPFNMQRGKMIPVPQSVVNVLNDAELPSYIEEEDDNTKRRIFAGMQKRYPFEIVRKLDAARYDALRTIALQREILPEDLNQLGM